MVKRVGTFTSERSGPRQRVVKEHVGIVELTQGSELPIHLAAVTDTDDQHDKFLVMHLIHNAIVADTDTAEPREFALQHPTRCGIRFEFIDGADDAQLILMGNLCQRLGRALLNADGVGHA